ncbi:MAG: hypothetical protein ABI574_13305 [Burkholderiales bacterium]
MQIGLFAGRGDVVLSMGLALLFGCWAGWKFHGLWWRIRGLGRGAQHRDQQKGSK